MPIYEYKALTRDGKTKNGVLDADTPRDARNKLRTEGIHVISLNEMHSSPKAGRRFSFFRRRNISELAMVTRQLATLLESGIPLREAVTALIEQVGDRNLEMVLREIREKITAGISLADAMAEHPVYFSPLYVNMVRAGEAAGNIDAILVRLADYLQRQSRMRGKVSAALAYPIVMLFIGAGVVTFLMVFVVPKITEVLLSQQRGIPLPTKILMAISDFVVNWWFLLIAGVMLAAILLRWFISTPRGRRMFDVILLGLPVMGVLFKKQAVSRFAVTFSTLLQSGITVLDGLKIVRNVVDNIILAETLDEVSKTIVDGGNLATPLKKSPVFPPVVAYMIAIGEQTGRLEPILKKIAETYDEEIDITTQKVTAVLEPLMIVALSLVVGFIVLSVILPIMEMSKI